MDHNQQESWRNLVWFKIDVRLRRGDRLGLTAAGSEYQHAADEGEADGGSSIIQRCYDSSAPPEDCQMASESREEKVQEMHAAYVE